MSGLPWVRLDTNCFSHDKTLWLIDQGDRLKKICMDDCLDVWLSIKAAGRQP